jgi:inner membrane protein
MRRTHAAAGLMIGFGLASLQHVPLIDGIGIALVSEASSLIPDLDLKFHIKHRGITHSLLALLIVGLLVARLIPVLLAPILFGYASHLILDLLTVYGIELFYPYHRRIRLMTFRTGGRIDSLLAAASLCVGLYFLWGILP